MNALNIGDYFDSFTNSTELLGCENDKNFIFIKPSLLTIAGGVL